MHAAALEAAADDVLAGALDDAGGDAQPGGAEPRIAHALAVARDVADAFGGRLAAVGVLAKGGEQVVEAALVEFVAALFAPLGGEVGGGAVDGPGDLEQVLLGVEDVDDLDGAGEVLVGEVPDPGGAVAEHDAPPGPVEAAASVSRTAAVSMAAL